MGGGGDGQRGLGEGWERSERREDERESRGRKGCCVRDVALGTGTCISREAATLWFSGTCRLAIRCDRSTLCG